ncbi:platelet-derived growth factor subunit B-like [Heterodontus francisci]|uniref:platelet-derived growth factor subunit B-like n=1 Tax=Heterodontus francisci TaxID=7792 RepID=UPI00355C028F
MHLGIALLILWYLWPAAEGDWTPSEHSRFQSHLQHQSLDADGEDSENFSMAVTGGGHWRALRVTRSPEPVVEDAKPAECKVRPAVIEITRSMVDPTTANFFVWPSCVEVQQCSGCCNTRNYKCQATKIQERHVQVIKRVYRRRRLVTRKAVVVLIDHVECKCMTAAQYADSREKEGPLVTAAPTVIRTRKYSSSKRKSQKFKYIGGGKRLSKT